MELKYFDKNLCGIMLKGDSLKEPMEGDRCVMDFDSMETLIRTTRDYFEGQAKPSKTKGNKRFGLTKSPQFTLFGLSANSFNISLGEISTYSGPEDYTTVGHDVYVLIIAKTADELSGLEKELVGACPEISKLKRRELGEKAFEEQFGLFLKNYHTLFYGPENAGNLEMFERDM